MDFIDESDKRQEEVQKISVEHTKRILGGNVGMLCYDVSTLYFETAQKDILRDNGFSKDGKYYQRKYGDKARLILGYSSDRAKKDAHNREEGVARLRKSYASGKITKSQVNKRGYNKFLEISKDVEVIIRAYGIQVEYMRSLPLHFSQQEINTQNGEYSDFQYHLCLTPGLSSHLLAMGETVKVLEPVELKEDIKKRLLATLSNYDS